MSFPNTKTAQFCLSRIYPPCYEKTDLQGSFEILQVFFFQTLLLSHRSCTGNIRKEGPELHRESSSLSHLLKTTPSRIFSVGSSQEGSITSFRNRNRGCLVGSKAQEEKNVATKFRTTRNWT